MKLFIYEHITSGALIGQSLPTSLAHEGDAMLLAVLNECLAMPGHSISIMRDARLTAPHFSGNASSLSCHSISSYDEYNDHWQRALEDHDVALVIAPETDNALLKLQRDICTQKVKNLGCSAEAIAMTGDKLNCHTSLVKAGIKTPKTCLANSWQAEQDSSSDAYLIKPIDGAGCIDTLLLQSSAEVSLYLSQQTDQDLATTVVQPYIKGDNISLSLLFSENDVLVLSINEQCIELQQQTLSLTSCHVNGYHDSMFSADDASLLAQQIKQAIPGLYGFVGIDLILTNNSVFVIDINPRLTSSYIGLSESLAISPMSLLLTMADDAMLAFPQIMQRQAVHVNL